MTENGKGYAAILKLSLPPDEQYHSGHSLILQADGPGQLGLLLQELDQTQDPILRRIRDFAKATDAVAPAAVLTPATFTATATTPDTTTTPVTLTVEQVAAQLGAQVPATTAGPPPQPAPVPAPAGSSFRSAPKVDGSQLGGSPGQQYPQGAQLGGPCPKCSVVTWWQEAFVKPDGDAVPAYWRCPNAKNHPKAY